MQLDPGQLDQSLERPLFKRLANLIRSKITNGGLYAGRDLPRSREIATQLGVSIESVHDAMQLLKAEGLLIGGRGKPYQVRVRPPARRLYPHRYTTQVRLLTGGGKPECRFCLDYGITHSAHRVAAKLVRTVAGERAAAHAGWDPALPVWRRELVESAGDVVIHHRLSIVPAEIADATPMVDVRALPHPGGVIGELHDAGARPDRYHEWWPVRLPTAVEAASLSIGDRVPVYEWMRLFYLAGEVVEISETVLPCDNVILHVEGEL